MKSERTKEIRKQAVPLPHRSISAVNSMKAPALDRCCVIFPGLRFGESHGFFLLPNRINTAAVSPLSARRQAAVYTDEVAQLQISPGNNWGGDYHLIRKRCLTKCKDPDYLVRVILLVQKQGSC